MKRIIFIAALLIAAATGARAQEDDNLRVVDFDYRKYFDIDLFWYDADQDGTVDRGETCEAGDGSTMSAYLDHRYFGKAGNITFLEIVMKNTETGESMVLRGSIDCSRLVTYDKPVGRYYQCGDAMKETAFVIIRGRESSGKNALMLFNIGAFPPAK